MQSRRIFTYLWMLNYYPNLQNVPLPFDGKFIAPLTAHLQPQLQTIDVDKDAEFQCIVSGHPVHDIKWLHDGKPILRDNRVEVWHSNGGKPKKKRRSLLTVFHILLFFSRSPRVTDILGPATSGDKKDSERGPGHVPVFRDKWMGANSIDGRTAAGW